jgi:hypothetical protein
MLCRLSYAGLPETRLYPETGRSSSPHVSRRSSLLKYSHFPAFVKCNGLRRWQVWLRPFVGVDASAGSSPTCRWRARIFTHGSRFFHVYVTDIPPLLGYNETVNPFSPLSLGSQCLPGTGSLLSSAARHWRAWHVARSGKHGGSQVRPGSAPRPGTDPCAHPLRAALPTTRPYLGVKLT